MKIIPNPPDIVYERRHVAVPEWLTRDEVLRVHHDSHTPKTKGETMLNQFIDDVISNGAEAALPQNLDQTWLDMIYVAAKNFLTIAVTADGDIDEDQVLSDVNSMMMLSSIVEIAQFQSNYKPSDQPFDIPEDQIFEYISCYSMAVILESIDRESDLGLEKPTISNIFDRDRLFAIEENRPEVTALLNNLIG